MIDFSKMSINELIDFAKMNSIDISAIHSGKGFRASQGKKYNKFDLVIVIQTSLMEQGTMEQGTEETMEQGTEETMEQGTEETKELKLDFDNTSIQEYKDFAISQDSSLSHIVNKVYGFLNNKTDFVRFICQLLKVDESEFIPTKEYQEVKLEKTDYDEKKEKMFNNIYQRFSDFINYLCVNNIGYDYPKFNSLIDDTAIDIYNFTLNEGKDNYINPFTLSNNLSELKTYLIPKILKDNKFFPNNILISNFIDLFTSVKSRKEIKDNLNDKKTISNTHINKRQSNTLDIECANLLIWTKNTLEELMDNSFWDKQDRKIKARWTDIAIALMIVTGRRSSEIMSSAKFTQIDYYHVDFIGQLKGNSYSLTPIKIPVLVNSELVILGLEWLEFMGKREKSDFTIDDDITIKNKAKKAHQRFSRYLNEDVKKIFSNNVTINNDGNITLNYDDGYKKNRANCHLMRQIYSQIAYQVFYDNKRLGKKKHFVLAEILGHESNEQNAKKASENYDSDFEIRDYDNITEIIGY